MATGNNPDRSIQKALEHLRRKGWVSLRLFAAIVGLSYPTVMKYKKAGKIAFIQVGGTCRVTLSEVRRFLKEGTEAPPPTKPTLAQLMPKSLARVYRPVVDKIMTERVLAGLDSFDNPDVEDVDPDSASPTGGEE